MKVVDYVVDKINKIGVKDAFGVPGGIVLSLIYAFYNNKNINIHLAYHEQGAAYAAVGYAQITNSPVVAYATHGPGILNMITAIVDAYNDSVPVIFITAHSIQKFQTVMRSSMDQEVDIITLSKPFTKYALHINTLNDLEGIFIDALKDLIKNRMGPIVLDFNANLLDLDFKPNYTNNFSLQEQKNIIDTYNLDIAIKTIINSKKPVILLGDGINLSGMNKYVLEFLTKNNIPTLSSKSAQDIASGTPEYFGYIGSHGIRYANFILSKSDCIISIGNRLAFNVNSQSFSVIANKAVFIRIDIDKSEFIRKLPNCINLHCEINLLIKELSKYNFRNEYHDKWMKDCIYIKNILFEYDINSSTKALINIFKLINVKLINEDCSIVCDVGNNELWTTRAYEYLGLSYRKVHSKSLKTAGSALPKAIGMFCANKKTVICITGDQGFQFNLQELNVISNSQMKICIIVINNNSSGMIRDLESRKKLDKLHVTRESGYFSVDIEKIAYAYGINYIKYNEDIEFCFSMMPLIIEIDELSELELQPILPKGNPCQDLYPYLSEDLYKILDDL